MGYGPEHFKEVAPGPWLLKPYSYTSVYNFSQFAFWWYDRQRKLPKYMWKIGFGVTAVTAVVTTSLVLSERFAQKFGWLEPLTKAKRVAARQSVLFSRDAPFDDATNPTKNQKAYWDEVVKKAAFAGDFEVHQFWRAARRTRPVELELYQAENVLNSAKDNEEAFKLIAQTDSPWARQVTEAKARLGSAKLDARGFTYRALAARWEINEWLDDDGLEGMFGSRYTFQAQKQDIGFTVDPWLGREDVQPETCEKAVAALDEKGFCLMKGALSPDEVEETMIWKIFRVFNQRDAKF